MGKYKQREERLVLLLKTNTLLVQNKNTCL